MIYPRLKVAKDLLSEDGVIFISINDYELDNLQKVCSEVFGNSNKLACFCWRTDGNFDNQARIKTCHEYILLYAKKETMVYLPDTIDPNIPKTSKIFKEEIRNTIIKNGVKNPISDVLIPKGFPSDVEKCYIDKSNVLWPQYSESITIDNFKTQNDVVARTGWASRAQLVDFINSGYRSVIDNKGQETTFVITRTGAIETIKKREKTSHVISVLNNMGGTQKATVDMGELGNYFDYPKPVSLMKYLSSMYSKDSDVILDFFSGSATTAHAVMQLNAEDAGNRKFIMVQLPEPTDKESEAYKAGYKNICEIGKERIRRAGKKILEEQNAKQGDLFSGEQKPLDIGFRVLKLDSSNMTDVYYTPEEFNEQMLFENNIKGDRTEEDLLFQTMIDLGIELSAKIERTEIAGKTVWNVADNYLLACFDEEVNETTITEIAKQHPYYFVMRDSSLANDQVADNFEQIFEHYSKDTIRRIL